MDWGISSGFSIDFARHSAICLLVIEVCVSLRSNLSARALSLKIKINKKIGKNQYLTGKFGLIASYYGLKFLCEKNFSTSFISGMLMF